MSYKRHKIKQSDTKSQNRHQAHQKAKPEQSTNAVKQYRKGEHFTMKGLFRHIDKSAKQGKIGEIENLQPHTAEHLDLTTNLVNEALKNSGVDMEKVKGFDKATRGRISVKKTLEKGIKNGTVSNKTDVETVSKTHLVQKSELSRMIKMEDRIKNQYNKPWDEEHPIPSEVPKFLATIKNIREGEHGDFLKEALKNYDYKTNEAKLKIVKANMPKGE